MKHYSKEFKEEALKLSDEIGVKKAAQQLGIAYRHCVLHAGGLAKHTPKYTARENAECGGAIHPHP